MEPNADGVGGIAEIASDTLPSTPVVDDALAALVTNGHAEELNGHAEAIIDGDAFDLRHMLQALQAMRVGDFSVRLPADQTGLAGLGADSRLVPAEQLGNVHTGESMRVSARPR